MRVLVEGEIVDLAEALVALIAVVASLWCVDQLMVLVVALLVEALAAVLAFPVRAVRDAVRG